MIDGSEKYNGWLNLELLNGHVVERRSNVVLMQTGWLAFKLRLAVFLV